MRSVAAVVRKLRAAASSLLVSCELTAEFHCVIAALLLEFAVLQAPTGSAFGAAFFALVLAAGFGFALAGVFVALFDGSAAELLASADRLGVALLGADDVTDVFGVDEGLDAPLEPPLEQALSATMPHAAVATTLSRRTLTGVELIETPCMEIPFSTKSRDGGHALTSSGVVVAIPGCASSQSRISSATHSG